MARAAFLAGEGARQQVFFHGEMAEAVPALHHLDATAAHQVVGRQPVHTLAFELDDALGDVARSDLMRLEIAFSVVDLPAPLAPSSATILPAALPETRP